MWRTPVLVCAKHSISLALTEWSRRGVPCVLLHGFADAACVWSHLASRLMPHFRTVALDLRGHGDSGWDPEARYDTETLTIDLTKAVAALRLERMILIGHSLGAAVAIRFAADNADRMLALVIVDFGPELEAKGVDEVLRNFVEMPRIFTSAEGYAEWLIARRPLADPGALRQFARCTLRQALPEVWELKADPVLAAGSELGRLEAREGRYVYPGLWPALERIRCPSLVIRGIGSGVFPQDVANCMVERTLLAGRLGTIGGAGHSVMIDNPSEFTMIVASFLAGISNSI